MKVVHRHSVMKADWSIRHPWIMPCQASTTRNINLLPWCNWDNQITVSGKNSEENNTGRSIRTEQGVKANLVTKSSSRSLKKSQSRTPFSLDLHTLRHTLPVLIQIYRGSVKRFTVNWGSQMSWVGPEWLKIWVKCYKKVPLLKRLIWAKNVFLRICKSSRISRHKWARFHSQAI